MLGTWLCNLLLPVHLIFDTIIEMPELSRLTGCDLCLHVVVTIHSSVIWWHICSSGLHTLHVKLEYCEFLMILNLTCKWIGRLLYCCYASNEGIKLVKKFMTDCIVHRVHPATQIRKIKRMNQVIDGLGALCFWNESWYLCHIYCPHCLQELRSSPKLTLT